MKLYRLTSVEIDLPTWIHVAMMVQDDSKPASLYNTNWTQFLFVILVEM